MRPSLPARSIQINASIHRDEKKAGHDEKVNSTQNVPQTRRCDWCLLSWHLIYVPKDLTFSACPQTAFLLTVVTIMATQEVAFLQVLHFVPSSTKWCTKRALLSELWIINPKSIIKCSTILPEKILEQCDADEFARRWNARVCLEVRNT